MQIIGFILGILIGLSLGLIGSGGSILTIPILVYVMNIVPSVATTYSLFIVGISALVGSVEGGLKKLLDFKIGLYFIIPSLISVFVMRKFIIPIIPNTIIEIESFSISKDFLIMFVFAVLMIFSSISMIKKSTIQENDNYTFDIKTMIFKSIIIGLLTGFVGVGGGFLIIPTLIYTARMSVKKAIANSLIIVAFNSIIGFIGSVENTIIDWKFLLEFTAFSIFGIFVGMYLRTKISNEKLKPAFGWFVLVTGIYIIIKELFIN